MGWFWAEQPPGRVAHLVGASPEAIELALEPLPADVPAVVTCYPSAEVGTAKAVTAILDELDRAATGLYPAWLPGAEGLDGPQGARVAAVRTLAMRKGAATPQFGPFLADLAERSLGGGPARASRFPAEVRAAGLARVVAESFGRSYTALLVHAPGRLAPPATQTLVTACEWLAQQGGFAVWLTATELQFGDRVRAVPVQLPERVADLPGSDALEDVAEPPRTMIRYPPLAGRPHPASEAEQTLEVALAARPWAEGRVWNRTYRQDQLAEEIRVDLMWRRERVAVEIDGDEHRGTRHYEADRRRDVLLQLAGFAVLRFTNAQVATHLGAVLSHLEQIVTVRRRGKD